MACEVMYQWSLSGLVGVFVDLVIAFFLLCASAMAFIASKFLGFFGLCLPCPCNGLFGITNPNRNYCMQRLLIDFPSHKVSNIQMSIKSKFPFNDFVEMEGEASCSSVSNARKSRNVVTISEELSGGNGNGGVVRGGSGFDVKGKGVMNLRSARRGKGGGGDNYDKVSSASSYDPPPPPGDDVLGGPQSRSSSIDKGGNDMVEDRMVDHDYEFDDARESYYERASRISGSGQQDKILLDEFREDEVLKGNAPRAYDKYEIDLEQALKEERAACSALYLELEKERNAAATAADEAMAMILRLQEEKAFFEMEARQYQRMIEEKSAYDAEEMSILKEILVRREMEKLFLEKELEEYRRMIDLANEQLSDDGGDVSEDPELMLHQLSVAIKKRASSKDRSTPLHSNDEDQKFQEKEIVSVGGGNPYFPKHDQEKVPEKTIPIIGEEKQDGNIIDRGMMRNNSETQNEVDKELQLDDVHVVVDGSNFSLGVTRDYPSASGLNGERDIQRSSSGLPPIGPKTRSLLSDLRGNSMSPLDHERLKMDNEVEWLWEKLKIVQEGREKLNPSMEHREREQLQLRLLEDISRQLQQMKPLMEPGKAIRHTSLPTPATEVTPLKRRSRSVSSGSQKCS